MRDSVETAVLNYVETTFALTTVVNEILDSNGSDCIVPRNWPITSVQAVKLGVDTLGAGGDVLETTSYQVLPTNIVLKAFGQTRGRSIVRVDYTYGYASLPADVKEAILLSVEAKFRRKSRKSIGLSGRSKKDESESFADSMVGWDSATGLPAEAISMLQKYRTNFEFAVQPMATRNP
jgi:hypothetical protein